MAKSVVFIDAEISGNNKISDLGAIRDRNNTFHSSSTGDFRAFLSGADYLCGHNIIHHDLTFLKPVLDGFSFKVIDTLYLSPLLFPKKPYHALLKDDKLQVDELNNPVNDCQKAEQLFYDEVNAFQALPTKRKQIYWALLHNIEEFQGFFDYVGFRPWLVNPSRLIPECFAGEICANADIEHLIHQNPIELAYTLALTTVKELDSITPPWLLRNYPEIENVIHLLRGTPCREGCAYCRNRLDVHRALRQIFGFANFRTYNGEPLQERAARCAVEGKSLIAVFPTGGGKSITFQLPALLAGRAEHGLTVVISPLQSLMKDQVDHLTDAGIPDAVTINGLLNPLERAEAIERVSSGSASILYISPEMLRSRTIEKSLLSRNVVRFVIDEAHCFSAWGQDFRVDYLYIGDFIRQLQEQKHLQKPIPVSCFTATAKQKVISDIRDYFRVKLGLDMELYASTAARDNLHYTVLFKETDEEKYNTLRNLIAARECPVIVYTSKVRRTEELADRLTRDGFSALSYNGKMESGEKIDNQEKFLSGETRIMVATSAFGMGVDKKDVGLVIHYDISDSLENYVQEAGRAGRDPNLQADCYVLFNNTDLDSHFVRLNQTKLSISEIQNVWKAIKDLSHGRPNVCCSAFEIARQAGMEDVSGDTETRVRTAVAALEDAGYVKRGKNSSHVFATGIQVRNMAEAAMRIDQSGLFDEEKREQSKRIMNALISERSISKADDNEAESRIDYLADTLGLTRETVIDCVNRMKQDGILADTQDMSAYIMRTDSQNKSIQLLERFSRLEQFLLYQIADGSDCSDTKKLNEKAAEAGVLHTSVKNIRTLLYFLTIKNYIRRVENKETDCSETVLSDEFARLRQKAEKRADVSRFILQELYGRADMDAITAKGEVPVEFSLVELLRLFNERPRLNPDSVMLEDVEESLLYLSKIDALRLEGGFLVLYNGMQLRRLVMDNRIKYKVDDYRKLNEYYRQKIQQIHIVGEFANMMVRNYQAALQFVQDYFNMDFRQFLTTYFKGQRSKEIERNITPERYQKLFGELSETQKTIINDAESKYITVVAGPGSGKTRVLVHKLAALLTMEDVKHDQLLMLTFSRAAATEFQKRLVELIGPAAYYVEIKTFHSFCFDLLGRVGSLEGVTDVVKNATDMIERGEVEPGKILKHVLVIDEAQDMDENEYRLVRVLMQQNEDMRVIAVGDDDQNIYEFRGSDSRYMRALVEEAGATKYLMVENYRSCKSVVALANCFAHTLHERMKTENIVSKREEEGITQVIRYTSDHFEKGIVNWVKQHYRGGTAAVLTATNDEAFKVLGLLCRSGMRARLIQSLDGFRLSSLMEIRFFLMYIDNRLIDAIISKELWNQAKEATLNRFPKSSNLEICRNLWQDFESSNPDYYRSDLEEFIHESNYDDFIRDDRETISVSTIHRSKGREFDQVYLLLDHTRAETDEEKRRLYVGMTRAKNALYIHTGTDIFSNMKAEGTQFIKDETVYHEPVEASMLLSHKMVYLDYFKQKKEIIRYLYSGMALRVDGSELSAEINGRFYSVVKLSKACRESVLKLQQKGYRPYRAEIQFIVSWKGEGDTEDCWVILPNLYFRKGEE